MMLNAAQFELLRAGEEATEGGYAVYAISEQNHIRTA